MYNIFGAPAIEEFELDRPPGYEGSKPVRVGNAASGQFQLDVYGEYRSCWYAAPKMGLPGKVIIMACAQGSDRPSWEDAWLFPMMASGRCVAGAGTSPIRRLMAWVFFDRTAKSDPGVWSLGGDEARRRSLTSLALRERIHTEVCECGFNQRMGAFTQSYPSEVLDASVLVIPCFGFLPGTDPRVRGTVGRSRRTSLDASFSATTPSRYRRSPRLRGGLSRVHVLVGR